MYETMIQVLSWLGMGFCGLGLFKLLIAFWQQSREEKSGEGRRGPKAGYVLILCACGCAVGKRLMEWRMLDAGSGIAFDLIFSILVFVLFLAVLIKGEKLR